MLLPIVLGTLISASSAMVQVERDLGMSNRAYAYMIDLGTLGNSEASRAVRVTSSADLGRSRGLVTTPVEVAEGARRHDWLARSPEGAPKPRGPGRPGEAAVHLNRGAALAGKGQVDAAIDEFRAALRLRPDDAPAHCNLGAALAAKGQADAAIEEYRAALRLRPDDAPAHYNLGAALAAKGQADAAIEEYRAALKFEPDDEPAHLGLGAALAGKGQVDAAIGEFRAALRLRPDDEPAHLNLGAALAGKGQVDAAIDEFRAALRLRPDDEPAHLNLGAALAGKGQADAAIDEFRAALRLRPDDAPAHYNLGAALAAKGQADAAIEEYRAALKFEPDDEPAHLGLGAALAVKGQVDAAIGEFRAALRLRPDDASAHLNLGTALSSTGQLAAAIEEYRAALRLRPDDASAFLGLGTALQGRGEFAGALEAFRRGHELGSRQPGWPYPSAQWVRDAERLAALEARLPGLLRGGERPADAEEALGLARICSPKGLHAAAARLYQDAFARQPARADDLASAARYNAACAAACAGSGRCKDDPPPDEATRARWRGQAREWLRADLILRTEQLADGTSEASREARQALLYWRTDPALAGLRDGAELARLPEAERAACREFWSRIDSLLNLSLSADLSTP